MELDCSPQKEEAIRQILGQRRQNQFISVLMRNEVLTRAAQHLNVLEWKNRFSSAHLRVFDWDPINWMTA